METYIVPDSRSVPPLTDGLFPEIVRRPADDRQAAVPGLQALTLLVLVLAAGASVLLGVGSRTPPPPAVDPATLPTPADFTPVPAGDLAMVLGIEPTNPGERAWTTAEAPLAALDTMVAALQGAGWALQDAPTGGILPQMPHLARLGRPGAHVFLNAWRHPADESTRVSAVEP